MNFSLCKAEQLLRGMESKAKDEEKDETDIGKLFGKSLRKMSIKSRFKAI